jgi:hypothetical protein
MSGLKSCSIGVNALTDTQNVCATDGFTEQLAADDTLEGGNATQLMLADHWNQTCCAATTSPAQLSFALLTAGITR